MRDQLTCLRKKMQENGIDYYLVPTDDFHASEYTGDYFKCRAFLSGFTGSAGTCVVSSDFAGLWTDGRYFLQASRQLEGTGFELMKMDQPGVPDIHSFIQGHLKSGATLGFDGRTVSLREYRFYQKLAEECGASLRTDVDLVGEIWADRPPLSAKPVFEMPDEYTGMTRHEKLNKIREFLQKEKCDFLLLSSLTDIAYTLNIRGDDVACTPVVLSYLMISQSGASLFVNQSVLSDEIIRHLAEDHVALQDYGDVYKALSALTAGTRIYYDPSVVNSALISSIPSNVETVEGRNPTVIMKGIKNPVEVEHFRKAHIRDGVAVTRFMYWLKKNVGKIPMTEISAAEKLESFRKEQPLYIGPSFSPIMAFAENGAIVHYHVTEETCAKIEPRSFLLADTGGQYMDGTTDITRTFALGELTDEEKKMYTLVLLGHLHLGHAKFRYGTSGANLDYLAREPLWRYGLDYNHGTGHGVGYVLSVHEGPQSFRYQKMNVLHSEILEPGMVTSDEPGIYLEGKFGVRLENLTVVCEDEATEYGRFLRLDYLTMVPWDLDAIDFSLMTDADRTLLNQYHEEVRRNILPYLEGDEAEWLKQATRAV